MITMTSNDEDFNLFLEEFGKLLNKYHYCINHSVVVSKLHPELFVVGFSADGKFIWPLVYDTDKKKTYSCERAPIFE